MNKIILSRSIVEKAMEALESYATHRPLPGRCPVRDVEYALRAALAEPGQDHFPDATKMVQEPVAWMHNLIDNIITHRPADIDRHPDRWTALYPEPKPCPTCEALARTVMMDQTGHDPAPPQRKPLTDDAMQKVFTDSFGLCPEPGGFLFRVGRAIERAHKIGGQP